MTGPVGNTGGSNVGTAFGKVRIAYESTGVAKATKHVEALQQSVVTAGKSFDRTGSQIDKATAQVNQFAAQTAKIGKNVKNPAEGLGKGVERETQRATKALAGLQTQYSKGVKVGAPVKLTATKVDIDKGSITKALATFSQNFSAPIKLNSAVKIDPSEVTINRGAIETALRSVALKQVTLRTPIRVDPSEVTVNQGAIDNALNQAGGATNSRNSGGAAGTNAGLAGTLGLLGRMAPLAGAAAAGIGAVGLVLTKGFSRLQGLDQAAIKLKALGYETSQIKGISDIAVKSVDGLSFGLDEAFGTAADALNANVQLKDLDKYLAATANTASLAGVGMQELGGVLSETAISGKLSGDTLNLLISRNVPILKLLGEEYGVTQQKAAEMVSNSEVDFNHLINALSKTGEAGKIMGNTVGGSFKNLMASVSRIGAMLLAPLFGAATGEASTFAKAIQWVTSKTKEFEGFLKENKSTIVDVWVTAGQAVLGWGQVTITTIGWILEGVGKLIEGIGHVPSAFAGIFDTLGAHGVADNLRGISDGATEIGQSVFESGQKVFSFRGTITDLQNGLEQMGEKAKTAGDGVSDLGIDANGAAVQMDSLSTALEKLGVKQDAVLKGIQGSVKDFKELMKTLKDKGASDALLKSLKSLRGEWDNGGRAAKNFSDAIDGIHDSSIDASSAAQQLVSAMQELGLLPGGEALQRYSDGIREMTDANSDLISSIDKTGNSLVNLDGTLNLTSGDKNASTILGEISKRREELIALAKSGDVSPGDAYDQTSRALKDLLERQAGITPDLAQKVIDKYLSPDGKGKLAFEAIFEQDNATEVIKQAFGDDPAKMDAALNLLTTADQIVAEITGGPGAALKIPAEIEITNPDVLDPNADPNKPGTLGNTGKPDEKPGPAAPPPNPYAGAAFTGGGFPNGKFNTAAGLPALIDNLINDRSPEDKPAPIGFNDQLTQLFNNKDLINKTLGENQDLSGQLQPIVENANQQGQNFAEAFAAGINSGNEEVKRAIIQLAMLAGDGLGNSPAKYGPLSGKGWSFHRGKTFTSAWAEGIEAESDSVKGAVSGVAGAAGDSVSGGGELLGWSDKLTRMISDLQQFSDLGKSLLNFGKELGDIAFSGLKMFNDLSGGRLFPKTYTKDPNKLPGGSMLPAWNPTINPQGPLANSGVSKPGAIAAKGAGAEDIQRAIIEQAAAMGFNKEQTLAALGIANQETGYGTNPRTNDIQNQNGTAGITGVFQQDMSYRKYGDPRDPNNAIKGFLTEFAKRGQGLNDPNPWGHAVKDVQIPAPAGGGGYMDADGSYLKNLQRQQALEVYDKIVGGGKPPAGITPAPTGFGPAAPTEPTWIPGLQSWVLNGQKVDRPPPTDTKNLTPNTTAPQGNAPTVPAKGLSPIEWIQSIAKQFNPGLNTSYSTLREGDPGYHGKGLAVDIDAKTEKELAAFAEYVGQNFKNATNELIYSGPDFDPRKNIGDKGFTNGQPGEARSGYYDQDTLNQHGGGNSHVHWAVDPKAIEGMTPGDITSLAQGQPGGQTTTDLLTQIAGNTTGLNTYLPDAITEFGKERAGLIDAIKLPGGSSQDSIVSALQTLDSGIADANKLGNKDVSSYLGQSKNRLMSSNGMVEGQNPLDTAQGIFNGAAGIATDVFAAVDAGLKTAGAVKDTTEMLTRGIKDTGDINHLIDNIQVGIDYASKIWAAAGTITSFVGGFTGGQDFGATQAAGGIMSMVGSIVGAVNTGIDIGQEVYGIATKYIGRAVTSMLGLPGATDMNFLLDEVTGEVKTWTSENPQMKTTHNSLNRVMGSRRFGERQAPTNYLTVYQGPGQDPRDTMDDAMFSVRSSGVGAFGYDG